MSGNAKFYADLLRLHFFFVWPMIFCSGLFLSFSIYGGSSGILVLKTILIGFFGFEAGFVLNDYVDRELDKKEIDPHLTKYWRPMGTRPLVTGIISPRQALALFVLLVLVALVLILTLPFPHSAYVFAIMVYAYGFEYFYQVKKRRQSIPIAQILGRTDFALFPVAGYLVNGFPDIVALLCFLFFYPFALAHLGMNDLIDEPNDKLRKLKTIPILYGTKRTTLWILFFTVIHFITGGFFLLVLKPVAQLGILLGFVLLGAANYVTLTGQTSQAGLKALPVFHLTMLLYSVSLILNAIL